MFVYGIWQLWLARDDRILKLCSVYNPVEENVLTWLNLDPTCTNCKVQKRNVGEGSCAFGLCLQHGHH